MIEAGIGLSSASSTVVAASEAASTAASGLSGGRADLAIVFATGEHADAIPSLLSSVERASGTPYIVGCSALLGLALKADDTFGVLGIMGVEDLLAIQKHGEVVAAGGDVELIPRVGLDPGGLGLHAAH